MRKLITVMIAIAALILLGICGYQARENDRLATEVHCQKEMIGYYKSWEHSIQPDDHIYGAALETTTNVQVIYKACMEGHGYGE